MNSLTKQLKQNKNFKFVIMLLAVFVMLTTIFTLTACNEQGGGTSPLTTKVKADQIKIDQIDWKMQSSVIDGQRRVCFQFDNNSQYRITNLYAKFRLKDGVTEQQITDAGPNTISQWLKASSLLKDDTLHAEPYYICEPDTTSEKGPLYYGFYYINDMSLYELYSPDIFTIEYIANDGLIHKEYYDFVNESYDLDDDVIDPNQWSDSERVQKLPRPENMIVKSIDEYKSQLRVEITDVTQAQYADYKAKCLEMGFVKTLEDSDGNSWFDATAPDGVSKLSLSKSTDKLTIYLNDN